MNEDLVEDIAIALIKAYKGFDFDAEDRENLFRVFARSAVEVVQESGRLRRWPGKRQPLASRIG